MSRVATTRVGRRRTRSFAAHRSHLRRWRPTLETLERRLVLAAPVAVGDEYATSQGLPLDAGLVNGTFELGDLTGWTSYETPGGTLGGPGFPDVVSFDIDGDGVLNDSLQLLVGDGGGGVYQTVQSTGRDVRISVDVAAHALTDNNEGGVFELLLNGEVIDAHDFGPIAGDSIERASLSATINVLPPGEFELRIQVTREDASVFGVSPFAMIDNVLLSGAMGSLLANDSDADGDALGALLVTGPRHGTLRLNSDGAFHYLPDEAFVGEDTFTYKVVEPGSGLTMYSIDTVNDKLVKIDGGSGDIRLVGSIDHEMRTVDLTFLDGSLYALNVGDDIYEVVELDPATGGVLGVTPIARTLTAAKGITASNGELYINYADPASCGGGACGAAHVLGRFDRSSGELTGLANYRTVGGGFNYDFQAISTDLSGRIIGSRQASTTLQAFHLRFDPDAITHLGEAAPPGLNLSDVTTAGTSMFVLNPATERLFRYEPEESGYDRPRETVFTSALGNSLSGLAFAPDLQTQTAAVTIAVLPPEAPLASNDAYTMITGEVLQTTPATGVLSNDLDRDGDELSVMLVDDVGHGTLQLDSDGAFTYTPQTGFIGADFFTYRADDGMSESNLATVFLFVLTDNHPPVTSDDAYEVDEDQPLVVDATAGVLANDTDEDSDPLTVELVEDVHSGQLSLEADGSFSYTPDTDFHGADQFTYVARDEEAESNSATVTITIHSVNDAPVAVSDQYSVDEDQLLNTSVGGEEPFTETLISTGAVWRYLDDGSDQQTAWREFAFDDSGWQAGPSELGYGDDDETTLVGYGGNTNNKFATTYFRHSFQVEEINRIQELLMDLKWDDAVAVYLNGVEVARENLAPGAPFDEYSGNAVSGADESAYHRRSIATGLLAEGTNVLAAEVHQAVATSSDISFDLRMFAERLPAPAGVLDNDIDVDGDQLMVTLASGASNGDLTLNEDGSFQYEPNEGFSGTDTFTYRIDDGNGPTDTATVTIQINDVNDPPRAADDEYLLVRNQAITINGDAGVLVNDYDPEGQPLTARIVDQPAFGTVALNADGSFQYTPDDTFTVADSFTYVAADGSAESTPATVTILADIPTIDVGDHLVLPNSTNQIIDVFVTGSQDITGVNIRAQIGDGRGPQPEPIFQAVDFTGGIWDAAPTTLGGGPIPGLEQFVQANMQFSAAGITTAAEGRLVRFLVDTTGFSEGTFDLLLKNTEISADTDFVGTPTHIVNGTITIANSSIAGRHIFYNNSYFDRNDPAADSFDDLAIATDKTALLPGETATFANYTSYFSGITGIMVDVEGLADAPGVEDFEFRVGNDNDPANWAEAPVPSSITVREDAGIDGSDRVTIVWSENTIQKQWLQVTVLATAATGLRSPDVFYFGNAVGDAGDSASVVFVDGTDFALARDNSRNFLNRAPVDFPYDYNRDSFVDGFDLAVARDNGTNFVTALKLIKAPGPANPPPDFPLAAPLFAAVEAFPSHQGEQENVGDQALIEDEDVLWQWRRQFASQAATRLYDARETEESEVAQRDGEGDLLEELIDLLAGELHRNA